MARKPKATSKAGKTTRTTPKAAAGPAAAKRAATSAPPEASSAFGLTDAEIERRLRTGESAGALKDYFGEAQYEELRRLSQQASTRSVRGGDRVLILPGIMGSTLGQSRAPWPADLIWFDPLDLMGGKLSQLALPPPGKPVIPLGVIAFTYLSLKLRLQIEGFDADFHPYDWRLSVPSLGADLAKRIIAERKTHARLYLVAHSMGGLVSRASLARLTASQRPDRIVMLGTPNYGSYAPVQAFRGVGGTVEKVDWLDQHHSKAELAQIFGAFPGLLEMIPAPGHVRSDLFDLAAWPAAGIRPDAARLTAARAAQAALPVDHPAIVMICGVGRDTVVDAQVKDGEFAYSLSKDGDGCVPLALAKIGTAAKTYYVPEEHGSLPNNGAIQAALPSILATGETSKLADSYTPAGSRGVRTISEAELAARNAPLSRGAPSVSEQRRLLEEFAAPPPAPAAAALAGAAPAPPPAGTAPAAEPGLSSQILVGRRRQRRLDVTVARGNITQSDAACYVMGLFDNVTPTGPAQDLDAAMGGGLSELVGRRMFGADVGEISILPKGRHPLRAQAVAFAGLGAFDRFDEAALATVGENLIRTLAAARIDDFATVLLGANSGIPSLSALRQLISGVLKGLADADPDQRFRSITICERDEERFNAIYAALYGLAGSDLFADLEVTLQRTVLPEAPAGEAPTRAAGAPATDRIYLIVRQDTDRLDQEGFTASLLTGGGAAAIESGRSDLRDDQGDLDQHLGRLAAEEEMDAKALVEFGERLGVLTLPENVRLALGRNSDRHLVVVHDAGASRVPWEALAVGGVFPSAQAGMSHRYEAADLSVAKWLKAQQQDRVLRVLLVVNPTGDLPGAKEEGDRIQALFDRMQGRLDYQRLEGQQARKSELLRCFSAGRFDVVHYAGHAFFDEASRSRSGLLCADREVLSGADLARVSNLPQLMFFNACEAARVRKSGPEDTAPAKSATQVFRNVSFAEALLRGGVANFIGTYWPVGDASAEAFARTFYETLLQSAPLNAALLAARRKVRDLPSRDWADYVFYGDPDFKVKLGGSPPGELPARLPASA